MFIPVLLLTCIVTVTSGYEGVDKRFLLSAYHWGPWSQTSTKCSTSDCHKGAKERQRSCFVDKTNARTDTSHCVGSDVSVQICSSHECGNITATRINGQWSPWSSYSSCSHTCGHGHKIRQRYCNNPAPSGGGDHCQGSSTSTISCTHVHSCSECWDGYSRCVTSYCTGTSKDYALHNCRKTCGFCHTTATTIATSTTTVPVVNGHWGAWSSASACSKTCGNGFTFRSRHCNKPAPSGGGKPCQGSSSMYTLCHNYCTPVWMGWSHWTSCSTSCDMGTITRHRTCNQHGLTASCQGNSTETHECSTGPCATWSHWFEGDCSVSCGNGTMERLRHCSTGRPTDCTGKAYEMVPCTNPIICI